MDATIDKQLLDLLACPKCKKGVRLSENGNELICYHCKLVYEIRDGIPIMLIDEARQLKDTDR